MNWQAIAQKDVQDAGRSKTLWIIFMLFVLLSVGYVVLEAVLNDITFAETVDGLAGVIGTLLPVIALLLGYKSIAYERINGSIALLLSFPHSRRDLVIGKYVGRSLVLLVPIVIALLLAGIAAVLLIDTAGALRYPWFLMMTALYGLAFLAVAIGISMSTTEDRRVTLGAFGAYLLFVTFWDNVVTTVLVVLYRFDFEILLALPEWVYLANLLKPSEAYYRLLHVAFDLDRATQYFDPGAPWYVGWWMALFVLFAWVVIPIVIGFHRFEKADL